MIRIEKPSEEKLKELQVKTWPVWECAPSTFDWHYDEKEVCYILEGKVTVKTADETVNFGPGDLVTFPAGLDCVWTVHERVRKHYRLG
ncbi:MAG TPA: cupin domain-containing protein [Bacillota bacterium]|jgi:uncharacterized cupin superfamily protein|nr:cupin domain-containing protein [Bacillota bacterium]